MFAGAVAEVESLNGFKLSLSLALEVKGMHPLQREFVTPRVLWDHANHSKMCFGQLFSSNFLIFYIKKLAWILNANICST